MSASFSNQTFSPFIPRILDILNHTSWEDLTFLKLSQVLEVPVTTLSKDFMTKGDVLKGIIAYIDEKTFQTYGEGDPDASSHEALFELLMCRLDVLDSYKNALTSISYGVLYTPCSALEAGPFLLDSLEKMLNRAQVSTLGILGMLKVKTFAIVYAALIKSWLEDKSQGSSERMMAVVDKLLKYMGPLLF